MLEIVRQHCTRGIVGQEGCGEVGEVSEIAGGSFSEEKVPNKQE